MLNTDTLDGKREWMYDVYMNDNIRTLIEEETPLIKFSLYTVTQAQSLRAVGEEIIGFSKDLTDRKFDVQRVYDLFWLWVLGAYETIRTMDQHKECFAAPLQTEIHDQKIYLAIIRVPFAKQEMRGRKRDPVYRELSATGFDNGLIFDIMGVQYNSTTVVEDFLMFIANIKPQDIVSAMPIRRPEQS